jgi:hypothetical protein
MGSELTCWANTPVLQALVLCMVHTGELMTNSYDKMVVAQFQGSAVADLLTASPAALKGVSQADAEQLQAAFGIKTIRDLAENPFFQRALAMLVGAGEMGFDPGPPLAWAEFLAAAPLAYYEQHPAQRFRLDFGPVYYRGRLDGSARVIVVGQDPSTNELLAHRVLIGSSGQRVQGFLRKLGLTRSYVMVNAFLFSVFGQFDAELRAISLEAPILHFRNAWLDRLARENNIQAVIAIGNGAQHAIEQWPGRQAFPLFQITHPAAQDEAALLASWNASLPGLLAVVGPDDDGQPDPAPYGQSFHPDDTSPIPPHDLPFGVPPWQGVGSHSRRDGNKTIIWTAP